MTFKQFLEGIELTKPAMYASIAFNLLNIILNYIFIYGKLGFPAMGLNGAGWATFIAKLCMGLSLAVYIAKSPKLSFYLKNLDLLRYSLKKMKELLRLGVPIALQYVLEVGAFAAGAVMMGWFGAVQLAAHNIALNPAALTYLMSSGISAAATIRISNFIGKRDFRSMKVAGNASYIMVLLFMGTCAIALISLRYAIPTVYIKESDVINAAANLLIIAGFFQLFDGIQVVSLGALRGMEDVKVPTLLALFAYWGVSLPGSYIFAVVLDIGAIGVWYGFLLGLATAALLLFMRYRYAAARISRR
jgi:MATE family multidrug resistance protein